MCTVGLLYVLKAWTRPASLPIKLVSVQFCLAVQSSLIALYPTRSRVVFDRWGTAARVINKNL